MMYPKPKRKFLEKAKKKRRDPGKPPTYPQAQKTADDMFSRLVRTKAAIRTGSLGESEIDRAGWFRCVTCRKAVGIMSGECGHFIPRETKTLRYDERNTDGQCSYCNATEQGHWVQYRRAIIERFGNQTAEQLVAIGEMGRIAGYKACDLIEMAIRFQDEAMALWSLEGLPYPWPIVNLRKQLSLFG